MSDGSDYDEDALDCPICLSELDITDRSISYCECGFQMCLWCYNRILEEARKENLPARCPNCRSDYDENKIQMQHIDAGELEREKQKIRERERPKTTGAKQARTNLANIRVVQPNLVYAVGLGLEICHEEVLKEPEFFGQFGKTVKVSVNRNNQYASAMAKHGPTGSAYVTFKRSEDALRCIKSIDGALWRGKPVKACFGTTKYCNAFLKGVPCNNPDCLYLHELADEADCLTKEEVAAGLLPARFLAMGATNTFKPRLTINVIPNAITSAAQAAAAAAAAAGAGNAAITAAAAAAGGISRTHSQHVVASNNAPRVLTIPASALGQRGRDSLDGGSGVWDSPRVSGHQHHHMSAAPPPPAGSIPPVIQPPAPKGVWASAVSSGGPPAGGGLGMMAMPLPQSNPLPPPPSDKTEWPTLAGAPGSSSSTSTATTATDAAMLPRTTSLGTTMAEQLARSQSGEPNKAKQGRKLMPLASPGKLKPLGKAVGPRSASPAPQDPALFPRTTSSSIDSNGNGISATSSLEATLGGLTIKSSTDAAVGSSIVTGTEPTVPPPGLGGKVVVPPPGFAGAGATRPKKVPPPPGFGGPPVGGFGSDGTQQMGSTDSSGGVFSPLHAPLVSGGSLFGGSGSSAMGPPGAAAAAGPPPGIPPVSRRQKSRFAFAQADEEEHHGGNAGHHGGGSLWSGGSQQQQQQPQSHHMPSQQDTNAFFKSLFPGATVNVAVAPGSTPPSGGISPLAGGGGHAYGGGGMQQYSPLGEMFSPQGGTPPSAGGSSGIPPGLALLRQLQSGAPQQQQGPPPGYAGSGPANVPPGFGGISQNGPPPGFGLPL